MKSLTVLASLFLRLCVAAPLFAQATNPPYLREFPPVERVLREIQGKDPDQTAAKQMGTFLRFKSLIETMAGDRRYQNKLTADETRLIGVYSTAYSNITKTKPEYQKFMALQEFDIDDKWRDELFAKFFSASFVAQYNSVEAMFEQRHQEAVKARADEQKQIEAAAAAGPGGATDPGTLQARRCIEAGRDPLKCALEAIGSELGQLTGMGLMPQTAGLKINGRYPGQGFGLQFETAFSEYSVAITCGVLVPDAHAYTIQVTGTKTLIKIEATPSPIIVEYRPDGRLAGPGAITLDGRIVTGTRSWTRVYSDGSSTPMSQTSYAPKTEHCTAGVLSASAATKSAGNVPPGFRMAGTYTGPGGMEVAFHVEDVIVGCGAATAAHPYTVTMNGGQVLINIQNDPSPIILAMRSDGRLAGSGAIDVKGRAVVGQLPNGGIAYAPRNASCSLGILSSGAAGSAGTASSPAAAPTQPVTTAAPAPAAAGATAVLAVETGLPMAGHQLSLMSEDLNDVIRKSGITPPAGVTPFQAMGIACQTKAPECQRAVQAINAAGKATVRLDAAGAGEFPALPPGTYYLVGSTIVNGQPLLWNLKVVLQAGRKSVTLNQQNSTPLK